MKVCHFRGELVARGFTPGDAFAYALHKLANGDDREVIKGEIIFKTTTEEAIEDEHLSDLLTASAWKELVVGET